MKALLVAKKEMNPAGRVSNWESECARFFSSFLPIMTKGLVLKGVKLPLVMRGAPYSLILDQKMKTDSMDYHLVSNNIA
jgi:hypothetical protein